MSATAYDKIATFVIDFSMQEVCGQDYYIYMSNKSPINDGAIQLLIYTNGHACVRMPNVG